jgi:hypothetical protein
MATENDTETHSLFSRGGGARGHRPEQGRILQSHLSRYEISRERLAIVCRVPAKSITAYIEFGQALPADALEVIEHLLRGNLATMRALEDGIGNMVDIRNANIQARRDQVIRDREAWQQGWLAQEKPPLNAGMPKRVTERHRFQSWEN